MSMTSGMFIRNCIDSFIGDTSNWYTRIGIDQEIFLTLGYIIHNMEWM